MIITSSPYLQGKKFYDDEVKTAVMEHFVDKEPEYFLKGTDLVVHGCEKCVEIKGDYIEKKAKLFYFCHLKKMVRLETFRLYLVQGPCRPSGSGSLQTHIILTFVVGCFRLGAIHLTEDSILVPN